MINLKTRLVELHRELVRNNLVAWTAGNISQRVNDTSFLIKPSGVSYDQLAPEDIVLCDLDGKLIEGRLSPSSDTFSHAFVYKNMPEVGGQVHTHSVYASAFAALGEAIPCVLTSIADEFGGEIPLGPFAIIGDDSIGQGLVDTLRGHRSRAVIMQNHGVFTIGRDATDAVKAAVMCEANAKTVAIARSLGNPIPLEQSSIDALWTRYQYVYGQPEQ